MAFENRVSEKQACSLAKAFWEEISPFLNSQPPSSHFLAMATRLANTGHENRLTENLVSYGLHADIPVSFVDVGLAEGHPVLSIPDFIRTLDTNRKIEMLLMGYRGQQFADFWGKWKKICPDHPIFTLHNSRLHLCIPIVVHFDEGTTLKKKSIMIAQWHPLMGKGTRKRAATMDNPGVNFVGHSLKTRFLYSVMLARVYSKKAQKKSHRDPLMELTSHLSKDLNKMMNDGVEITLDSKLRRIYLIPVGMKGDWPALSKVAGLVRHFGRVAAGDGKGICHLCKADQLGYKRWHIAEYAHMLEMHRDVPTPWTKEPPLTASLGLKDSDRAAFYRIDMFHTLHKGIFADLAANIMAYWLHLVFFMLNPCCQCFISIFLKFFLKNINL